MRRHFAHKQLANCSLAHERPEIVEARAVLYEWIVAKFPDQVQIEYRPADGTGLPRPIDIFVTLPNGRHRALWIFDVSIKQLQAREEIQGYFASSHTTAVTWIFLSTMLTTKQEYRNAIPLSKMERDFTVPVEYDKIRSDSCGTLHYLDAKSRQFTTFRRLIRIHAPSIYRGDIYVNDLSALLVDPETLEITHPTGTSASPGKQGEGLMRDPWQGTDLLG